MEHPPLKRRSVLAAAALGTAGLTGAAVRAASAAVHVPNGAHRQQPSAAPPDPTGTAALPVLAIPVVPRESWQARPPQAPMERHRPRRLTLHHTALFLEDNALTPARLRRHQDWHMDDPDHNYPDIAYHFMVDMAGTAYEGRDWRYRGDTATEYDPTGHFLVCCEGDYDQQQPTRAQLKSVAALFAWAAQKWDIRPNKVAGHSDYAATTCPGKNLEKLVTDRRLRRKVRRLKVQRRVELVPAVA